MSEMAILRQLARNSAVESEAIIQQVEHSTGGQKEPHEGFRASVARMQVHQRSRDYGNQCCDGPHKKAFNT